MELIFSISTAFQRLREADYAAQQRIILQTQRLQEFLIRLREGLFDIQRVLSLMIRSCAPKRTLPRNRSHPPQRHLFPHRPQ